MYIKKLTLSHFGKFREREIECKPGINIIYGENEAGKSTIHSFIRGMLFGIEKTRGRAGKDDLYTKYQPLDTPGSYEGSMEFTFKNEDYLVFRRFYQKEKYTQLINVTLGKELKNIEGRLFTLFPELTESAYRNTVSIEQLHAKTDAELASEVRNYIANLTTTKASEVDVNKAISSLLDKKKEIEVKNNIELINKVAEEIEEGKASERAIEQASKSLKELLNQKKTLEQTYSMQIKKLQPFIEKGNNLPVVLQKYGWVMELLEESKELTEKINIITQQLQSSKLTKDLNVLDEDIRLLENLIQEQSVLKEHQKSEQPALIDIHRKRKKIGKFGVVSLLLGIILCVLPFGHMEIRMALGLGLILLSFLSLIYTNKKLNYKAYLLEDKQDVTSGNFDLMEEKKKKILFKYNCNDVATLRDYQKQIEKEDLRNVHLNKQLIEYKETLQFKQNKIDSLYEGIMNYTNEFISCDELSTIKMQELEEEINNKNELMKEMKQRFETEKVNIAIQIDRLENLIIQYQEKESILNDKQKEYEELLQERKALDSTLEAIKLAISTIKELSVEIHDSFGTSLSNKVSEQLSAITRGKYKEVLVDENLNIKILHGLQYIPLEKLSVGAIEQVYFALRLAIGDLLFDGDSMPLILDDSFAYYDDYRLEAVLQVLASIKERQIFIFTCHHREKKHLTKAGISFTYTQL